MMMAKPTFAPAPRPSLRMVLGWPVRRRERSRLQGMQYARLAGGARAHSLIQAIAALATLQLFAPFVAWRWLIGWGLLLAGLLIWMGASARTLVDADERRPPSRFMLRHILILVADALVWMVPIGVFATHAPASVRLELWTILATLLAVSAVIVPAVPLDTLVFSGIIGGAMVAGFVATHNYQTASMAALFVVMVIWGAIEMARHVIASCLAEASMSERDEVVSLLLGEFGEESADWLWQIDSRLRVEMPSTRFAGALGVVPQAIEGQSLARLIAGNERVSGGLHPSLHDLTLRLRHRQSFSKLLVCVVVGKARHWWELSGMPRYNEQGVFVGYRGVGSDVTAEHETSERIAWLAKYDALTGLPNRVMLGEVLAEVLAKVRGETEGAALREAGQAHGFDGQNPEAEPFTALLMIDLDRFKGVNDALGHHVGDHLLGGVAERLKSLVTDNVFIARLGGDEFALVIRDASRPGIIDDTARKVIEQLSEPCMIDGHLLQIGASIGAALAPRDGRTIEALMRNADLALYRAKHEGGGRLMIFAPDFRARAESRRRFEVVLRDALDREEFELHYQPIVAAHDARILGFEALLRWQSSKHGGIRATPVQPIIAETGLVTPIGEWVLAKACAEAVRWPTSLRLAVNVAAEQLLDPAFHEYLARTLSNTGLAPDRLDIEIAESVFVRDIASVRTGVARVMALGCGVTLDNFGTGHLALAHVPALRLTTIKIDRSIISGVALDTPDSLAIIRTAVTIADSLGITVAAQGVETAEELALLRAHKITLLQGHYFGRPMPAANAMALITPKLSIAAWG